MDGQPSDVMRTWFQRVWTEREEHAIYELFPPEGEAHGLGPAPIVGPGAFHQFWVQMHTAFDSLDVRVLDAIDQRDRCYVRCEATGIYRGALVTFEGGCMAEIHAGQIRRVWSYLDFVKMLTEMSSIPPNALELALSGVRFA